MNTKVIIGIIVLAVVLLGGYFYISSNKPAPSVPQMTAQPSSAPAAETTNPDTINLTSSGFSPSSLTVKAGTKVTWVNQSGADATVNSNPHPVHTDYAPLNLGKLANGATLSLTFDKPGTYGFHNHLNPSQTGSIIVQ